MKRGIDIQFFLVFSFRFFRFLVYRANYFIACLPEGGQVEAGTGQPGHWKKR